MNEWLNEQHEWMKWMNEGTNEMKWNEMKWTELKWNEWMNEWMRSKKRMKSKMVEFNETKRHGKNINWHGMKKTKWNRMKWLQFILKQNEMKWNGVEWKERNCVDRKWKEQTGHEMNGWMTEWLTDEMNVWMNQWMNEWMDERSECMNAWMHESMNEWTDETVNELTKLETVKNNALVKTQLVG